jgi:hypothetical protein
VIKTLREFLQSQESEAPPPADPRYAESVARNRDLDAEAVKDALGLSSPLAIAAKGLLPVFRSAPAGEAVGAAAVAGLTDSAPAHLAAGGMAAGKQAIDQGMAGVTGEPVDARPPREVYRDAIARNRQTVTEAFPVVEEHPIAAGAGRMAAESPIYAAQPELALTTRGAKFVNWARNAGGPLTAFAARHGIELPADVAANAILRAIDTGEVDVSGETMMTDAVVAGLFRAVLGKLTIKGDRAFLAADDVEVRNRATKFAKAAGVDDEEAGRIADILVAGHQSFRTRNPESTLDDFVVPEGKRVERITETPRGTALAQDMTYREVFGRNPDDLPLGTVKRNAAQKTWELRDVDVSVLRNPEGNKLYAATIDKYKKDITAGRTPEAPSVEIDESGALIVDDGNHRVAAYRALGRDRMRVWVRTDREFATRAAAAEDPQMRLFQRGKKAPPPTEISYDLASEQETADFVRRVEQADIPKWQKKYAKQAGPEELEGSGNEPPPPRTFEDLYPDLADPQMERTAAQRLEDMKKDGWQVVVQDDYDLLRDKAIIVKAASRVKKGEIAIAVNPNTKQAAVIGTTYLKDRARYANPSSPISAADDVYLPGTPVGEIEEDVASAVKRNSLQGLYSTRGAPPPPSSHNPSIAKTSGRTRTQWERMFAAEGATDPAAQLAILDREIRTARGKKLRKGDDDSFHKDAAETLWMLRSDPRRFGQVRDEIKTFLSDSAGWYPAFARMIDGIVGRENALESMFAWSRTSPKTSPVMNIQKSLYAQILIRLHPEASPEQLAATYRSRKFAVTKDDGDLGGTLFSDKAAVEMFRALKDPQIFYSQSQKTGHFEQNTISSLLGLYSTGSTQDAWMARYWGYGKDALTAAEFRWAMAMTNAVAKDLGIPAPMAVQAIAWMGLKDSVGSVDKPIAEILKRNQPLIEAAKRVIGGAPNPKWQTLQKDLYGDLSQHGTTTAFIGPYPGGHIPSSDVAYRNAATIALEPGPGSLGAGLQNISPRRKRLLRDAVMPILTEPGAYGRHMTMISGAGVANSVEEGIGSFENVVSPNLIIRLQSGDPEVADFFSAILGKAFLQDAVPWMRSFRPNQLTANSPTLIVKLKDGNGQPLSVRQINQAYKDVKAAVKGAEFTDLGEGGLVFGNFEYLGVPDAQFKNAIDQVANLHGWKSETGIVQSNYLERGYGDDFIGPTTGTDSYDEQIRKGGPAYVRGSGGRGEASQLIRSFLAGVEQAFRRTGRVTDAQGRALSESAAQILGSLGLPQKQVDVIKGMALPEQAVVVLSADADRSTLLHETMHIFVNSPQGARLKERLTSWAAPTGQWNAEAQEKIARGLERYFAEGIAPTKELHPAFAAYRQWMGRTYGRIRGSAIDIPMTDDVRQLFAEAFTVLPEQKWLGLRAREMRQGAAMAGRMGATSGQRSREE